MADTGLIDQYGRPLKRREVEEPFAAADMSGSRSPLAEHPGDNLTPSRLASILRASAQGEVDEIFSLAEDIEERELHYLTVLNVRKRQIAKLAMNVEAAENSETSEKHADFIRAWLRKGALKSALFDILDAIGKGYSITEIDWQMQGAFMLPAALYARPQRWFNLAKSDFESIVLKNGDEEIALPAHKFIIHKHPVKTGLTIRGALIRPVAWAWMYKSYTQRDWAIFVQNYGMPLRIGRYDNAATEDDKSTLRRAVRSIAGDMSAILPQTMQIEFVELKQGDKSGVLYQQRADWFDRQVSKVVLGQTTTTDAISGGHAVSQEHYKVLQDIEEADAALLEATLNSQLIPNIIAFNFGPQEEYPTINLARGEEMDIANIIAAVKDLGPQGLTVPASWLRDKLGAPAIEAGEETVGGRASASAPAVEEKPQKKEKNTALSLAPAQKMQKTDDSDEVIIALTERAAADSKGALAGLTGEIRQILEEEQDLFTVAERLAALNLQPAALSNAMARALALSNLAGQAAMVTELKRNK